MAKVYRGRLLLALGVAVFFTYVVKRGAERGSDFKYPYNVARALWQTGRLHVWAQPRYPVTFHALLAPLASFSIGYAAAAWAAISFAAVFALPRVFRRLTGLTLRQQLPAWLVVLPCLIDALVLGQSDPINLLLVASGLLAVQEGRAMAGTGLVGIAGMIKILPLLHWMTILSRCGARGWRGPAQAAERGDRSLLCWSGALLGMVAVVALAFGLVVLAAGWDGAVEGFGEQFAWIRDHEKPWHLIARQSDLRVNNESLPIVLARTFGDLGAAQPRHSLGLGIASLDALWWAWGAIVAVLAVAWLAAARAARGVPGRKGGLGMCALTAVLMLATTPICWHHYFLWLMPGALYLAERRRLLLAVAAVSLAATALPWARGVGLHMLLALGVFVAVASDLWRSARVGAFPTPIGQSVKCVEVDEDREAAMAWSHEQRNQDLERGQD